MEASRIGQEGTPVQLDDVATAEATSPPAWDTGKAVQFLAALRPKGLLAVSAIVPDGSATGETFALPDEHSKLTAWIERWQGCANLYFRPNEPVPVSDQTGKAGNLARADMAFIHFAWVDCDPREAVETTPGGWDRERARFREQVDIWLSDAERGPSVIIDSGNGVQALWRYSEPFTTTPATVTAAEAQNKALAHLLGGDKVHDIGRLLRIPFTVNMPGEKKRVLGRVPAQTKGKVLSPARAYSSAQLAEIAPPVVTEPAAADIGPFDLSAAWDALGDPEKLDLALAASVEAAAAERPAFARLLHPDQPGKDRSKRDYAIARECIRAGVREPADIAAVIAAFSPDKFEALSEQHGSARAEAYMTGTVTSALQAGVLAGAEAFFNNEEGNEASSTEAPDAASFGEPIDLFGDDDPGELSSPPAGCLPDVLDRFVRAVALEMGVPESFVAVPAVAALGAAIGNGLKLYPRQHGTSWEVPATFPVVIVAPPGRKKLPTLKAVLAPLRGIERDFRRTYAREKAAWDAHCKTLRSKDKAGAPPPPKQRQALIDDATIERLIQILADNPRGCCVAPDEFVAWLGNIGAYKRSGEGDRGTLLKLIDGSDASKDRVSGSVYADTALIGVIASTQPNKMRELARNLSDDGMLQRFVFIVDDGIDRKPLDAPTDTEAFEDYAKTVRGLFALDHSLGAKVRLSPAAYAILNETWDRVDALRNLPGSSEAWAGHVSKWDGLIYRITLIFHAVELLSFWEDVPTEPGFEVTAATARRVSQFVAFLMRHALSFYTEFFDPTEHSAEARNLAGYLLTHPGVQSLTPRLIQKVRRKLSKDRRLTLAIMRDLENAGWVQTIVKDGDGPTKWAVNPKIHERFAEHAAREKVLRANEQAKVLAAMSARKALMGSD